MSDHTPGPWAWRTFGGASYLVGDHGGRPIVLGVHAEELFETYMTVRQEGRMVQVYRSHPDAQLIAAAPELLKAARAASHALKSLLAVREGLTDEAIERLARTLDATVDKATGKETNDNHA